MSQPRVATILNALVAMGLVDRMPAGSASLFVLNRDHVAARAVEELAALRSLVWRRIGEHSATWVHAPEAVVVYGSAARGDGGPNSDVDLLVVRPDAVSTDDSDWHHDLTDLAAHVRRWSGNPCDILDRSPTELRSMADAGERLLGEIRRDGRAIVGDLTLVPSPQAA